MLLEVSEFCWRVERDFPSLVDVLRELTRRYGEPERMA